ncbi:MAG: lipid A deacylase LpxR family protein [Planctomycetes bacterium]|nr:lipid A deacylase LpxR family protein [Planctomycetota bacterium]
MLVILGGPSWAQVEPPSRFTLTWENDAFARTDRHYTNGLSLALAGRLDPWVLPAWLRGEQAEWGLEVGQRIYTPERLEATDVVVDDRPYAGWSYLGLSVTRRASSLGWEDTIELRLGVIGPSSGAQEVQELAHSFNASQLPRGWRHQLRDEPGIVLSYRAGVRALRGEAAGLSFDVTPRFGISVGNVATFASVGVSLRCGLGVPDELSDTARVQPIRLYVTASAEVRFVGYDLFLDGGLFRRGSHRVEKEPLVADASLGLILAVHDRLSVSYTHTIRTPEFVGQSGADQFGSFSVTFSW